MNETEGKRGHAQGWQSRVVSLVVQRGENGTPRIVLEGAYMDSTGFEPGDRVDAIIQPELISILNVEQ